MDPFIVTCVVFGTAAVVALVAWRLYRAAGPPKPAEGEATDPGRIEVRVISRVGLAAILLVLAPAFGVGLFGLVNLPPMTSPVLSVLVFVVSAAAFVTLSVPLVLLVSTAGWLRLDSRRLVCATRSRREVIDLDRDFTVFVTTEHVWVPFGSSGQSTQRTDIIVSVTQVNPQGEVNIAFRYVHLRGTPCPPNQGPVFDRQLRVAAGAREIQERLCFIAGG